MFSRIDRMTARMDKYGPGHSACVAEYRQHLLNSLALNRGFGGWLSQGTAAGDPL